jgi:hypothetical protein
LGEKEEYIAMIRSATLRMWRDVGSVGIQVGDTNLVQRRKWHVGSKLKNSEHCESYMIGSLLQPVKESVERGLFLIRHI